MALRQDPNVPDPTREKSYVVNHFTQLIAFLQTSASTSAITKNLLDILFSIKIAPVNTVSDSGKQCISEEFKSFLKLVRFQYFKVDTLC